MTKAKPTAEATSEVDAPFTPWWGEFEFVEGELGYWCIGPLCLWARRRAREWRFTHQTVGDGMSEALDIQLPARCEPPETARIERFASVAIQSPLTLAPMLGDRPIVTRPETPFHLPPEQQVDLYVSTPLWVKVNVPGIETPLLEIPTVRPSDTWFGTTRQGELCYAVPIKARIHIEQVAFRPHRAITQIRIINHAEDDLLLERLNLPVPNLSLYLDDLNRFWTETVSVERMASGVLAEVRLGKGPPQDIASEAKKMAGPRFEMSQNVLTRALHALLG